LITILGIIWVRAILRVRRVAAVATDMAAKPTLDGHLAKFADMRDEIGTLARIIDVLVRRSRSRNRRLIIGNLAMRERVKLQQSILDAIGHEIRSPLHSLQTLRLENADATLYLERMSRAVAALSLAASVQAGIENGRVAVETEDLAAYLAKYAANTHNLGVEITYSGVSTLFAEFDPIALEQVLEHLLSNAKRFRAPESEIVLTLSLEGPFAAVGMFNQGNPIAGDVDAIFNWGTTTASSNSINLGQGLFTARVYMAAMNGSIAAHNVDGGVRMELRLKHVQRDSNPVLAASQPTLV